MLIHTRRAEINYLGLPSHTTRHLRKGASRRRKRPSPTTALRPAPAIPAPSSNTPAATRAFGTLATSLRPVAAAAASPEWPIVNDAQRAEWPTAPSTAETAPATVPARRRCASVTSIAARGHSVPEPPNVEVRQRAPLAAPDTATAAPGSSAVASPGRTSLCWGAAIPDRAASSPVSRRSTAHV